MFHSQGRASPRICIKSAENETVQVIIDTNKEDSVYTKKGRIGAINVVAFSVG